MKDFSKKISAIDTNVKVVIMNAAQMFIVVLVLVNALCRYVLKINLAWSEEMILFAAYYLYFAGIAEAGKQDRQLSASMVGMFTKNKKIINFFKIIKHVVSLFVCIITTVWSFYFIADCLRLTPKSPVLKYPLIWVRMPELICFILMDIYLVYHVIHSIKVFRDGEAGED